MKIGDTWLSQSSCTCGAAIIMLCCNDQMSEYRDAVDYDYWAYCSSKACPNHDGKGVYSGDEISFADPEQPPARFGCIESDAVYSDGTEQHFYNVVPLFGKEHELHPHCWCVPAVDAENPALLMHNTRLEVVAGTDVRATGSDGALERLAALEHAQWAHWTRYMLDNLSDENIARWRRQVETAYADLSESEKESDREWARKARALLTET